MARAALRTLAVALAVCSLFYVAAAAAPPPPARPPQWTGSGPSPPPPRRQASTSRVQPAIIIIVVVSLTTCCIVLCILRFHRRANRREASRALLYDVDGGERGEYRNLGGGPALGMPFSYREPGTFLVTGQPEPARSYAQPPAIPPHTQPVPPVRLALPPAVQSPPPPPPPPAPPPPPPPPQDPLEIWTEELALPSHAYLALRRVGVSRMVDLTLLDDIIIDELGLPPVSRKKLVAAVAALARSREEGSADAAAA